MQTILPKGIVVNTRGISGDIGRIDQEPLAVEEIAKLWKVYTTTTRRLLDPTAERLENFWWRIWGSRKRRLSGANVARLFAVISDGNSFVPLRGPRNRDESGAGLRAPFLTRGPATASTTAMPFNPDGQSSHGPHVSNGSKDAARPPPILKKARGPSSAGPRPTARFISPHSSEEEEAARTSSSSGRGAQVVVRPPTPESQLPGEDRRTDSSTGPRRRVHQFPASNAGHKRRPGVTRRPNSDPTNRAQEVARGTLPGKEPVRNVPDTSDHRKDLGKLQDDYHSPQSSSSSPNGRQEGKGSEKTRPRKGRSKAAVGQSSTSKPNPGETAGRGSTRSAAVGQDGPARGLPHSTEKQELLSKENESPRETAADRGSLDYAAASSRAGCKGEDIPRPGSGIGLAQSQHARNDQKSLNFKSSISLEPTYTTVPGNINVPGPSISASADDDGRLNASEGGHGSSVPSPLFARRPLHSAKSASPLFAGSVPQPGEPMSRSKSQLTLLLERDRVKSSEQGKRSASEAKEPDIR